MFLNKFVLLVGTSCCSFVAATGVGQDMRRDLASIQGALGGINTALASLDSAILKNPADPKGFFSSISVLESIQQATASINASQPLGPQDTSNLKATTDSLVSNVNLTVTDLIKQKPVFDRLKLEKVVLLQVQNIQGAALVLASTLASKVDPTASALAHDSISALNAALQRGIEVYSGTAAGPQPPDPRASDLLPPSLPSSVPQPNPPTGSIGPGPWTMIMPIPGTFEAGSTCVCMCPPVAACGAS